MGLHAWRVTPWISSILKIRQTALYCIAFVAFATARATFCGSIPRVLRNSSHWNLTETLMTTEYTQLQKSPILYPRQDYLLRSAQCNTDLWGNVFDVLQYRAEWVCIKLKQGALGNREEGMKTFAENCIHRTIDELLKLRQDDKETPIVLLHDLGKYGSHSPNAKTSWPSVPTSPHGSISDTPSPGLWQYRMQCI